jgi:hypothetical protein
MFARICSCDRRFAQPGKTRHIVVTLSDIRALHAMTDEKPERIALSAGDRQRFVDLLLNPPAPTPAMERAREAHRRLFGNPPLTEAIEKP